jgi:type II secretion system protein N
MMTIALRRKLRQIGYLFPNWPRFRFKIGVVLVFLIFALLGLSLTFPSSIIERQLIGMIEEQALLHIEKGTLKIGLFRIYGEDLLLRTQLAKWLPFDIDKFEVAPRWLSLLSLNPAVRFKLDMWDGQIQGRLHKNGSLTVIAKNLKLNVPLQQEDLLTLGGTLILAEVETQLPLDKESVSRVDVTLENGQLKALGQEIPFGTLVLKAAGQGDAFRVPTLVANGGDYAISGGGNVLIRQPFNDSRLNLRIEIRPQAQADATLTELLRMLSSERKDGSYQLRIRGPLTQVQVK